MPVAKPITDSKIISGVYVIFNLLTGKAYVGGSKDVWRRWYGHQKDLLRNAHHCKRLQHAWNTDGADSFMFEVLLVAPDRDARTRKEQYWMDWFRTQLGYYNVSPSAGSNTGFRFDAEQRAKLTRADTTVDKVTAQIRARPELCVEIARTCGITRQAVYKWRKVPPVQARAVAALMRLTPSDVRPDVFGVKKRTPRRR